MVLARETPVLEREKGFEPEIVVVEKREEEFLCAKHVLWRSFCPRDLLAARRNSGTAQ
jgi:hypothetical protein